MTEEQFQILHDVATGKDGAFEGWPEGITALQDALDEIRNGRILAACQVAHLIDDLVRAMQPTFVQTWLTTPKESLDGMTPVEAIACGQITRVRRMVYQLGSGEPI